MVAKRFNYYKDSIELKIRKVTIYGCAAAQAESLKFKLTAYLSAWRPTESSSS